MNKESSWACPEECQKVFAVNAGNVNSMFFGNKMDEYDICAAYNYNGDKYTVSLYSKEIDTSEISESLGGGGHPGASGFTDNNLPF
jgi:nanoRNase/pAp phosphatase (c-di-AMP/oligoRNAs hydrolase)